MIPKMFSILKHLRLNLFFLFLYSCTFNSTNIHPNFIIIFVDKKIIGGLIVKVGSKMIDSSISSKINKLKIAMKGA